MAEKVVVRDLETMTAAEVITWSHRRFGRGLVFASSFGMEDMVLIDMAVAAGIKPRVFYLDTDLLFAQTYDLIARAALRYGLSFERVRPLLTLEQQAAQHGEALWRRDPDACCAMRKVRPLRRYLGDKDAWVTGIRREQSPTRRSAPRAGWDAGFGLFKLNPLVDWTAEQVRAYVREHDVPVNPLHDRGYPSIGCVPCTRAVRPGEDPRAGRWSGLQKTECGLHQG